MTDFETWWREQTVNQSSELFPAYIKAIAKMAWEAGVKAGVSNAIDN